MLDERWRRLRAQWASMPPGPWEVWTSNSWRRIKDRDGAEVLTPIVCGDGHPDLSVWRGGEKEEVLKTLAAARTEIPALVEALSALAAERDHWQQVALDLADIHAANLSGAPARLSKSRRRRLESICERALLYLAGGVVSRPMKAEAVAERLQRAVEASRE